ncbi:MAG: mono-functional DNA-alkylating methyl methanesulfonate N-term-domain-containing protein [Benniella sp.]|nr:MAG: mono-functional DNA-alkylating methyl methanesulfonate N-term-domain-containing protein [Benniella sp.]
MYYLLSLETRNSSALKELHAHVNLPAPNGIIERLQQQVANVADQIASLQKTKESDEQLQEQLPATISLSFCKRDRTLPLPIYCSDPLAFQDDIADDESWDHFRRYPENATMRYKPLKVPSVIQLSPAQKSNDQQLRGLRKRLSQEGDLHKVTIDYTGDTSGFLFVASEFGNHHFYQFEKLGDDDDTPGYARKDFMMTDGERLDTRVYFKPRPLENLLLADELASMAPLQRSTMRILRRGLEVTEMAVSPLPANPTAVWTTRLNADELYDQYIIVSFSNATLVLSIGEAVEEVTDTGFLATTPTIAVQQLGQDALLQIYPQSIRHIRANKQVTEWRAPGGRQIVRAATNRQQFELVYFEVDDSGNLSESHVRREMSGNVTCLSIQPLPKGRRRVRFLAVGCDDNTVRILSLESSSCLEPLSMQALSGVPESLVMIDMPDQLSEGSLTTLYLNIGLQN